MTRGRWTWGRCSSGSSRCWRRSGRARSGDGRTDGTSATATVKVGIVYSRTGLLSAYGAEYIQGLRLGLEYATKGTNKVGGKRIELTRSTTATDPAKAVTAAKDLIGQGYKIIAGSTSSGVALAGRADRRAEQGALHLGPGGHRRASPA